MKYWLTIVSYEVRIIETFKVNALYSSICVLLNTHTYAYFSCHCNNRNKYSFGGCFLFSFMICFFDWYAWLLCVVVVFTVTSTCEMFCQKACTTAVDHHYCRSTIIFRFSVFRRVYIAFGHATWRCSFIKFKHRLLSWFPFHIFFSMLLLTRKVHK